MVRPLVIVGDTPETEPLEQLLAEWGWVCLRAPGEEVTSTLARTQPPLLLLALEPGAQGLASAASLTERIRATAYGALVPMVFFGPGPKPNPVEVLRLGGDAFIALPGDPSDIKRCIQRLAGDPAAPESRSRSAPSKVITTPREEDVPTPAGTATSRLARPGGSLDDLDRLDALPWEDLPDLGARRRRLATGPGADALDLDRAMAGDALLDPRTLAAAIASEAGDRGRPQRLPEPELLTPAPQPAPSTPGAGAPPIEASAEEPRPRLDTPPPSELEDLVAQLAGRGQDSDTVAVKIQKMIDAFDAGALAPDTPGAAQSSHRAPRPSRSKSAPRPLLSEAATPVEDIDLSALDLDTIAGVEVANPDLLLDRLSQEPIPAIPSAPGPTTHVTPSSGSRPLAPGRTGTSVGVPTSGFGSGTGTSSVPGRLTGSLAGLPYQDDEPTQPPLLPPLQGQRPPTAHEPSPQASAPLASPYDLPPLVAGTAQFPMPADLGQVDKRDTVPGRRTAILLGVRVDPAEEEAERASDRPPAAEVTQPESPSSRRGRPLERPAPAEASQPPRPTTGHRLPGELREGRLEALDPARLLCRLAEARATGTLRLETVDGTLELLFQEGRIRFATSTRPGDRMLALLTRRGLISELQADEVEAEVTTSGRRAGAILLDRGWIKPAELIPCIREHLEHLVMEVFGLDEGAYLFRSEWPTSEEIVHIEREPAALVFEGVRRKYPPERVRRLLGVTEVRPLRRPEASEEALAGCALTGRDWRLLDAMEGRLTLGELGAAAGMDPDPLWSLAYALYCLGVVALPAEPSVDAPGGGALRGAAGSQSEEDAALELEIQRILRRRDLAREGDYFALLGADPEATSTEISEAHTRILKGLSTPPLPTVLADRFSEELEEIRAVLHEARDVLSDERLRERYRRYLAVPDDTEA